MPRACSPSTPGRGRSNKELPVFVAIAVASDRFDPFRYRDEIPYTAIDLVGRFGAGQLHSEYLSLDAPSLGMLVSGQVGLVPPNDVEAVLGLFFFPTLDSLINRVPVLNRVILGRDENLMGAYFAMTGNWKKPKAQLIPVKSFAEGPAHFMLEGPDFIWSGLRRLESLLNPSRQRARGGRRGRARLVTGLRKARDKILSRREAARAVRAAQRRGERVVFTSGCFDLLHVGHLRSLEEARSYGDRLVVAVNSDASVRRIKGQSRPIIPMRQRAELLAALECVGLGDELRGQDTASDDRRPGSGRVREGRRVAARYPVGSRTRPRDGTAR